MLETNLFIGNKLLEGTGKWALVTAIPKLGKAEKKHTCPLVFNLDNKTFFIDKEGLKLFREDDELKYRYINPEKWGRRGKKFALTTEPRKFSMMIETIFGAEVGKKGSALLSLADYPELKKSELYKILERIYNSFERDVLNLSEINKQLNFSKNKDEVVLFYIAIQSEEINDGNKTPLFELEGFETFIFKKFGPKEGGAGLDYLTGRRGTNVTTANFERGYNPNAIFQSTLNNYASNFNDFSKNFKTDPQNALALDKAGKYYKRNFSTQIARISHLIIPSYRHIDLIKINMEELKPQLKNDSDLLFQYQEISEPFRDIEDEKIFWINYLAYESDGNSFKIINLIKDVSNQWLISLIKEFYTMGIQFDKYVGSKYHFNLRTIYSMIPVKRIPPTQKKRPLNRALLLFKDILEQRKINQDILFQFFKELLLCQHFDRHKVYDNIPKFESEDFAIKDAVFKYHILIKILENLNLLTMEAKNIKSENVKSGENFENAIEVFFNEMNYSEEQKGLFYLGRMVSQIGDVQYKKNHKTKPVLNKINFDGMDADNLLRLVNDLTEKAVQYSIHSQTDWNLAQFNKRFKKENWSLGRNENIFYLMAGYTFKLTQK